MAATVTVPDYAWSWLQRSRDVVQEISARLTGESPAPGFMDQLRPQFAGDQFVRDVVIGVVVDVAFNGRVPTRRPAGTSWDRGLTWWAATCAGITPAEFERRSKGDLAPQPRLFGGEADPEGRVVPSVGRRDTGVRDAGPDASGRDAGTRGSGGRGAEAAPAPRLLDRDQVAQALRGLLAHEEDGRIPAAAVRALLGLIERD